MLPKLKTILYCTMIGPNSPYIFRHALSMAKMADARIHVLHVQESLTAKQEELVEHYVPQSVIERLHETDDNEAVERLKKRIMAICETEKNPEWQDFIQSVRIAHGKPEEEIISAAKEVRADMIVMGANSRHTVIDNLIGDTTEKVVRRSPIPVLTVQVPEGFQEKGVSDI